MHPASSRSSPLLALSRGDRIPASLGLEKSENGQHVLPFRHHDNWPRPRHRPIRDRHCAVGKNENPGICVNCGGKDCRCALARFQGRVSARRGDPNLSCQL